MRADEQTSNRADATMGWEVLRDEVETEYEVFSVRKISARPPDSDEEMDFHVIDGPDSVVALPITTDGRIVLVRQYRHGIAEASIEFPAGNMDGDEKCATAALRELEEETGFRAAHCEVIGKVFPDPALQRNTITIVAAFDCTASGKKNEDEGESVETLIVTPDEVDRMIATGEIRFAVAIAAWAMFNPRSSRRG